MSCCRESNEASNENIPFPITPESKQWLIMMKYMLNCAETSLEFLDHVKTDLEFNNDDLERFSLLCFALEQARHQMALLGKNFFNDSSTTNLLDDDFSMLSALNDTKNIKRSQFIQTGEQTTQFDNSEYVDEKMESAKKDACLCHVLSKRVVKKSHRRRIKVCSKIGRSSLENEKCLKDGKPKRTVPAAEDFPNDDNNPFIIRNEERVTLPENGLGYELFYAMHRHRKKIAQIEEASDSSQTFEELLRDITATAINLQKKGLNEDSLICLCVSNNKYSCMPYVAGLFLGSIMTAIDISFDQADIAFLLKLATPEILFVQYYKVSVVEGALKEIGLNIPLVIVGGEVEGYENFQDYLVASEEDIKRFRPYRTDSMRRNCIILFSSGTSGLPKGICLSHYTVLGQVFLATMTDNIRKTFVSYTSFYWISAVMFFGYCTIAGISRIVPEPFEPIKFFKLVEKYKIESAFLGPHECIRLISTEKPKDVDTNTLQLLCTGGASVREMVFIALRKVFPGCLVFQYYGQTETAGLLVKWSTKNPEDLALIQAKPTSCGRPFGGFWYKIVDEDTGMILGPHKTGELYVKSDMLVMNGYYRRDSADCFDKSGWLKTGDLAYYDEYHCIFVMDRVKELIKYRGWHVQPTLLENILMTHPVVFRAVVIGIPHPDDGEHPMGCIVLKQGIDPETVDLQDIIQFANSKVDERKQLRGGLKVIQNIPFTSTGKVRRRSLRDNVLHGYVL